MFSNTSHNYTEKKNSNLEIRPCVLYVFGLGRKKSRSKEKRNIAMTRRNIEADSWQNVIFQFTKVVLGKCYSKNIILFLRYCIAKFVETFKLKVISY